MSDSLERLHKSVVALQKGDPAQSRTARLIRSGRAKIAKKMAEEAVEVVVDAMRGKLWFFGGLAAGFVLGARAGRETYEDLVRTARKIKDSPTVQEAAGVVQEQATRLYSESKDKVTDKLANSRLAETRLGQRVLGGSETGFGATTVSGRPARKIWANHTAPTTSAIPTSGCASNSASTAATRAAAMPKPGKPG